uniref:Uncharacterized protein n=1 Tax=Chromera velia CCMP2878 TaxID=1169474 RepID=A0A0G4HXA4_9ALVE|eukprot:Cvel_33072.t1-p1 / transcript=Cvel_33072.t1 / gene=Cvel_33072 / organism=Chromera_velia_CCMP2878 / gene_product=Ankyrin-1, putative / transcript_product=Ankyrin-1, putative / location=Cvel_scaffold5275:2305-4627(+) / protein_length=579 / sequence_SO=supercontig / SO=protein_coding / is_pseudo=false
MSTSRQRGTALSAVAAPKSAVQQLTDVLGPLPARGMTPNEAQNIANAMVDLGIDPQALAKEDPILADSMTENLNSLAETGIGNHLQDNWAAPRLVEMAARDDAAAIESFVKTEGMKEVPIGLELEKIDVNEQNKLGQTALHIAVNAGATSAVMKLLALGANPNIKEVTAFLTPIHLSAKVGDATILTALLDASKKTGTGIDWAWKNHYEATSMESKETLQNYLDYGEGVTARTSKGIGSMTPLHYAAEGGFLDCVKALVEFEGGDSSAALKVKNAKGETVLHAAAKGNNPAIIDYLMSKDDGTLMVARDMRGRTALHAAAEAGAAQTVSKLLQMGYSHTAADKSGNLPMHVGCNRYGKPDVFDLFVSKGLKTTQPRAGFRSGLSTPLHLAAANGNLALVQHILKKDKGAISAKDALGEHPTHDAVRRGQGEVVSFLLKSGADLKAVGVRNHTPLEVAQEMDNQDMAYILENGGKMRTDEIEEDAQGNTKWDWNDDYANIPDGLVDVFAERGGLEYDSEDADAWVIMFTKKWEKIFDEWKYFNEGRMTNVVPKHVPQRNDLSWWVDKELTAEHSMLDDYN